MAIIDAHHHLWDRSVVSYPWLAESDPTAFFGSYERITDNYCLDKYLADTANQQLVKSVHIQADADHLDPVAETRWLSTISGKIPTAIVAYVDLSRDDADSVLERHCEFPKVRGVRQILNYHTDPRFSYTPRNFLEDERWLANFGLLASYSLSFDLQIYFGQMRQAAKLAARHDDIQFILNHTGMPIERSDHGIQGWREGMRALSSQDNVAVKISGLGMTEPDWSTDSIRPFVLETIDMFGTERCMFGSNFPVDSLFRSFDELFSAYRAITDSLSSDEKDRLFRSNAERFYRI